MVEVGRVGCDVGVEGVEVEDSGEWILGWGVEGREVVVFVDCCGVVVDSVCVFCYVGVWSLVFCMWYFLRCVWDGLFWLFVMR